MVGNQITVSLHVLRGFSDTALALHADVSRLNPVASTTMISESRCWVAPFSAHGPEQLVPVENTELDGLTWQKAALYVQIIVQHHSGCTCPPKHACTLVCFNTSPACTQVKLTRPRMV